MIITVAGLPGSGKSTLAKGLAKKLGFTHHSTGDIWRKIAKERNLTPLELNKLAEKAQEIDREVDRGTVELAKQEDNFVMDSRMAWHFIPDCVKIFVEVDLEKAAERIFKDMRSEEKENTSVEKTYEHLHKRMESEKKRYKELYNVDYQDRSNYDLVLNSTHDPIEETLANALEFLQKKGFTKH